MVRFSQKAISTAALSLLLGFQVSLAQWDGASSQPQDSMTTTTSTPNQSSQTSRSQLQPQGLTAGQIDLLRMKVNSGQSTYQVGRVLAWGGLAANVIGTIAKVPVLSTVGTLSTTIGIPVMGVGAGKAERASLDLNPNGTPANRTGWPIYWTGWGLQLGGAALIFTGISSNIERDEYGDERLSEDAVGPILIGVVAIISGAICHYVAWYQFSERLDQSELNMAALSYVPTLHFDKGRVDGAGLSLALAF